VSNRTYSGLLAAAAVACCCVLGLSGSFGAAPAKAPFANPVEQRFEMIEELKGIRELLKQQNELLREQNALLKSGKLTVVVAPETKATTP